MPARRTLYLLGVILGATLALDVIFYTGYFASDDVSYAWAARHLAVGDHIGTNSIAQLRLAINIPSGLVYWLSGGDVSWIAWSFALYHLALVGVAFAIGNLFHGTRAGVIAAAMAAASPLFYVYAGAMLPDNATAVWLGLFLIALEKARRLSSAAKSSTRQVARAYIAAGIFLGVAYSCKESGIIMTIPAAACIIVAAPRLIGIRWIRDGAFLAAGLAAAILVEVVLLRILAGEWLFRLSIETDPGIYIEKMAAQGGASPIGRFKFALFVRLEPIMPLTMWLLPAAAAGYIFLRDRSLALITFFWWPVVFLTIGSTSLSQYEPPTIHSRYYAIVLLPAIVMAAHLADVGCQRFAAWKRRPGWIPSQLAVGALILFIAVVSAREALVNLPNAGNLYRAADSRGFIIAYETARRKYPQYPIVLAPFFRRRMTQLLFDATPEDVYADFALTRKPLPEPPFVLLESAAKPEGLEPLGFDLRELRIRTIESIVPPARRVDVLRHGLWRAFGATPQEPIPQSTRGRALVQLVERRDQPAAVVTEAPPPLIPLWSRGVAPPRSLQVHADRDGHLVTWDRAPPFHLQRFDYESLNERPRLLAGLLSVPSRALRLTTTLENLGSQPSDILFSAFGYDDNGLITRAETRFRFRPEATEVATLELRSEVPLTAYKIRMMVTPRPSAAGGGRSTIRVGPTTAVDATGLSTLPEETPRWHALGEDADVIDAALLTWEARAPHVVQFFDRLALVAPPPARAAQLALPSRRLQVDVALRMTGGAAKALVYVYGYSGGKQVAKSFTKVELDSTRAIATVVAESDEPIESYRVRVQITPASEGGGSIRLGSPVPIASGHAP